MYSKTEVCFTIIAAVTTAWCLNSRQNADLGVGRGEVIATMADGGHPPPPVPPPAVTRFEVPLEFIADGGHPPPPPPPQRANIDILQTDGGHRPPPVPPPAVTRFDVPLGFIADGGHPPPPSPPAPSRLFSELGQAC